jgi:hypothetical protein
VGCHRLTRPFLPLVSALVFIVLITSIGLHQTVGAQSSTSSPVTSASVNSHGNITAVYEIQIDSPGTYQAISNVQFGQINGVGNHYAYVDLSSSSNTSSPLSVSYGIQWKQHPSGMTASVEVLRNGTWVDLNSSMLILRPGENTMVLPHTGYQSAVRIDLFVGNVTTADYDFNVTVYGFVVPSQNEIPPAYTTGSTVTSAAGRQTSLQPGGLFGIQFPDLTLVAAAVAVVAMLSAIALIIRTGGIRRRRTKLGR